jgi:hypothetical protein
MIRRSMRTFLAVTASAAVGLLAAGTASAGAQTVQTAGRAQRSAAATLTDAPSGVPGANAAPTISATSQLSERRFVAAGTDAYVVGVEDGTFPPIGWHTTGQMGGVFTPPVKLLDGLWFGLSGSWLDSATSYTSGPGFVRLTFPVTDGLQPTLTEFAPDGLPTVLFGLTLVPVNGSAATVAVTADAHSEVSATYPWSSTTPTWDQFNHQNTVSAANGVIQFNQEQTPWYADVASATAPSSTATGSGYWGPTSASDQATFGTKGEGGQLTWNLAVPAAGRTLWLGVAGSQNGPANASQALQAALANPAGLLLSKIAERDNVAAQTNLQVPDAGVQQALLWSKLNLADLSRTIDNAAIRDTQAGTVYPAPLATVPQLSAIDAAYPDYAEFFGTDGAYSSYGLAVSGQWQTAVNWLNAMRTVSQIVNGSTGKVVHEVTATGAVYYGDTTEPGDINETAQFAIAADLVWRWSGDNAVLSRQLQVHRRGGALPGQPGHRSRRPVAGRRRHRRGHLPRRRGAGRSLREHPGPGRAARHGRGRARRLHRPLGRPAGAGHAGGVRPVVDLQPAPVRRLDLHLSLGRHRLHRGGPAAPAAVVDQRRPDGAGHRAGPRRRRGARAAGDAHL